MPDPLKQHTPGRTCYTRCWFIYMYRTVAFSPKGRQPKGTWFVLCSPRGTQRCYGLPPQPQNILLEKALRCSSVCYRSTRLVDSKSFVPLVFTRQRAETYASKHRPQEIQASPPVLRSRTTLMGVKREWYSRIGRDGLACTGYGGSI